MIFYVLLSVWHDFIADREAIDGELRYNTT